MVEVRFPGRGGLLLYRFQLDPSTNTDLISGQILLRSPSTNPGICCLHLCLHFYISRFYSRCSASGGFDYKYAQEIKNRRWDPSGQWKYRSPWHSPGRSTQPVTVICWNTQNIWVYKTLLMQIICKHLRLLVSIVELQNFGTSHLKQLRSSFKRGKWQACYFQKRPLDVAPVLSFTCALQTWLLLFLPSADLFSSDKSWHIWPF